MDHPLNSDLQKTMVAGFLRCVASQPLNNALFVNERYYSYAELWQIVHSIYDQIPNNQTYTHIGIYCNDDVYTYAAILAVNLYGAAYVPLNNKFPVSRNKNSIETCQLKLVLSAAENSDVNELGNDTEILLINDSINETQKQVQGDSGVQSDSTVQHGLFAYQKVNQPIAYILFTSGSTGHPKGVPVSHSNAAHFFNYFLKNYDFNEHDRFLQVYEITFDVSVFSFFMPLMVGACCYVLPTDGIKYLKTIEHLQKYNITIVSMVPTVLRYLENYLSEIKLPDLRYSFFSGDSLYHSLAVKWSKSIPNAAIHNFYGPTETTIVCTRYIFDEQRSAIESVNGIVPLGLAFEGMETLIVDENNQPTEKGELCFYGTQIIESYLNNTNEDCFFDHQNKRFYKTGDIASVNKLGNLVFHGRSDTQVKINGYRIELAEIENAVSIVTQARCIAFCLPKENSIHQLVVFVEKKEIHEIHIKELLQQILPDYMIPTKFIAIEKFELNINGKVDKGKLLDFA